MRLVPSQRLLVCGLTLALASLALLAFPELSLILLAANLTLVGIALLDWLLTPSPRMLNAQRLTPEPLSVLKEETVAVVVSNRSRITLWVCVRDSIPPVFITQTQELAGAVPAEGELRLEYRVIPSTRGAHTWGPLHLSYRSLLGMWERRLVAEGSVQSRVYPNLTMLHRYHILARSNHLSTMGIRKVRLRGGAWEFESLRDYASGDDIRMMDWKATARRRKLIVREHRAERNQTILLLIDSGRLMNAEVEGASKLDHAINTALVLAHVALSRGDRVGLCTFSHKVHNWVTPRGHVAQNRLLTESLFDLRGDFTETDHSRCLRFIGARHPKRALLVILSDFVDAVTAENMVAHLHLAARRHLVLFTALKDPFLDRAAHTEPEMALTGFRKAAALELLHDREVVLEELRMAGMHVLDVGPSEVTPPLLNRYIAIADRGLL